MSYLSKIAEKAQKMPPLPTVVARVLELTADPDYSTAELIRAINMDQAVTAHVLRRVNSAFFGLRYRCTSLEQAVPQLGADNVAEIALDAGVAKFFKGSAPIWRHSMATALTARELGKAHGHADLATLHTSALLHDVGMLIIAEFLRDVYEDVQYFVKTEGYSQTMAEREALGIDHAELGARIGQKWKLAPETVEVIALHHEPAKARLARQDTNIVCLANHIVNTIGYRCLDEEYLVDLPSTVLFEMRLTRRELDGLTAQAAQSLEKSDEILELLP
ncbi:metal dependent phosphohydrolase [Desulfarculus baarsii DSM 2075]|uniref:Metal dependent phosphohydrolase n=1 Tax=Desulfarculus baarsii (strain ATCC 33931 / DSM 2075 / LMG 7858 / VKM B-1802 / 2st14) TaxID=644282 RepID=E1QDX8_DESB2|nr:HDOD domain-containing protein [Desulfarculus baarsii]ADK83764.1 metal dependent phosphohydrolase [Desulfarculus baarsii DSM 2075]